MTPDEYQRAGELFERICSLSDSEQAAILDRECPAESKLRQHVMQLLAADKQVEENSFLRSPAIQDAAQRVVLPVPEALPPAGTVLGKFRLDKEIGAGGMGVVYEAHDLHLQRQVAVKILTKVTTPFGPERIERFQREARAAGQLNHPNIASIFESGYDRGYYYIAMEFVVGRNLRELIAAESGFMDSATVLQIISQTASALSASHAAGIIHRDIKPENIMVRTDGFVKVLDFGLAAVREPPSDTSVDLRTRPGHLAGTIQYLSPEQVLGRRAQPQSDLFSLGVVAYELLTSARPFDGPTDGAIFDAILHRDPQPPSAVRPEIGKELDGLIMGALEKDPDLRFQNATEMRNYCRRLTRSSTSTPSEGERLGLANSAATPAARKIGSLSRLAVVAAVLCIVGATFVWLSGARSIPRVTSITQITHDGFQKFYFVTDGVRIYYATGYRSQSMQMFQVSANGGEPVRMAVPVAMYPLDVSRDGSQLLLGQNSDESLWVVSTAGGPLRRVGDLTADGAQFSPKGEEIVYGKGPELRMARSDGSDSRLLATVDGNGRDPVWSPDGRSIRFTRYTNSTAVWEISTEATQLHKVFQKLGTLPNTGGRWTPDGKYYVFSVEGATKDLWVSLEHPVLSIGLDPGPFRLTNGPIQADDPRPTPDGRKIFFRGRLHRGEVVRYDGKLGAWSPYLQGLAATQLDFSRDGKSIVYVSYPEGCVWRCGIDGTARVQLTTPPLFANNPRWSPDGTQIVFYGAKPGQPNRLYLVPAGGGVVRQLTHGQGQLGGDEDGNWSADGKLIVFGAQFDTTDPQHRGMALGMVDVNTGQITKLAGSEGMWSPRWSFDGRYIAALRLPDNRLFRYDHVTHKTTQVTTKGIAWPCWSRDSKYIYFGNDQYWRVRIEDGKLEQIPLKDLNTAERSNGWVGWTPDGFPISTRDEGSTEIYALNWDAR